LNVVSLTEIIEELQRLSWEECALMADRLAETGDPLQGGEVAQAWIEEANRRDKELTEGRVQAIPGVEALARVRNRFAFGD
jgi:hypothetical protein